MLVLARKKGDAILIGKDIVIKIVYTNGGTIGVGIQAPRNVPVNRMEVVDDETAKGLHHY